MAAEDRRRAAKAEEMAAEDRLRAAKAEEMAAEDRQRAAQAEEKVAQADARTQEVERKLRGKLLVWFCWCCWSDGFSGFPSLDFTFSNLWPGPSASPTIDHEIAIPFVNRENQVDILARTLLQSRAVIDTASNRELTLATSVQPYGSGKSYFGENFLAALSAGHHSPVDPDAPPLHTLQFFDELTRAIYIRADISECWTTDATSTLNHTILLGVLRTVRKIPAQQLHQQTGYESLSALEEALRKALDGALISIPCYRFVEILQTVFGRNVFLHLDEVQGFGSSSVTSPHHRQELFYTLWTNALCQIIDYSQSILVLLRSRSLAFLCWQARRASKREDSVAYECVLHAPSVTAGTPCSRDCRQASATRHPLSAAANGCTHPFHSSLDWWCAAAGVLGSRVCHYSGQWSWI